MSELEILIQASKTLDEVYRKIVSEPPPIRMIVVKAQMHIHKLIEQELGR